MSNNAIKFLKNGNIDLNTVDGRMYFCFAEDEYPAIRKDYPGYNKEELQRECLCRWDKLVEQYKKYKNFLEVAEA